MSELSSIRETAPKLHIAEVTLRRLIKKRQIPFRRIGRKYFFTNEDINNYLNKVSYPIIEEDK